MPRPALVLALRRAGRAAPLAALALPPPLLHAALASAAGTAFEAAPFVLAGLFLRSPRLRGVAALGSCGCGVLPGALSIPALALCWLAFGAPLALLRFAAGAASFTLLRSDHANEPEPEPDPLAQLEAIAFAAFVGALACEWLRSSSSIVHPGPLHDALLFVAGLAIGIANPCASAAVATAAGLRSVSVAAASGLLASAGIISLAQVSHVARLRFARQACKDASREAGPFAYGLLGIACASLVLHGADGFVHPRLLPLVAAGSIASIAVGLSGGARSRTRATLALPLVLLVALVAGSPAPLESVDATNLSDAFPGAIVRFSGAAQTRGPHTVLIRYAITCCRADASPVALALDEPLRVRDGTWVEVSGTLARSDAGLVLKPAQWHAVATPADPFLYR